MSGSGIDAVGSDSEAFLDGLRKRIEDYGKDVNKLRRVIETAKNIRKFDRDPENDILSLVRRVESGNEDIHSNIKRLSQLRFQPTTRSKSSSDLLDSESSSGSAGRLSSKHVVLSKKLRKDFQKIEARATELRDNAKSVIADFKRRAMEYNSRKASRRRRRQLQQRGGGGGGGPRPRRQWIAASLDSDDDGDDIDESSEDIDTDDDAQEAMQLLRESANVESDLKLEESLLQQRHSSIKNLFGKMVQVQDTFAELNNLIVEQEPDVRSPFWLFFVYFVRLLFCFLLVCFYCCT